LDGEHGTISYDLPICSPCHWQKYMHSGLGH
jgi:hypothetical protein